MTPRIPLLVLTVILAGAVVAPANSVQDNPQETWSVLHADTFGTARNPDIPYLFDQLGAREAWQFDTRANGIDRVAGRNQVVFDTDGNVYWRTSVTGGDAALASVAPDGTLRWTTARDLGGYDSSSPIVGRNGKVYVLSLGNNDPANSGVRAYNIADGTLAWTAPVTGMNAQGITLTPVLHDGYLYGTADPSGGTIPVWCVDAGSGLVVWQTDLTYTALNSVGAPMQPGGHIAFVPDVFGAGQHGLFFNVDPLNKTYDTAVWAYSVSPSGGSFAWQAQGGKVARSHLVYSETTGWLYAATWRDYGATCYLYDAVTGDLIAQVSNAENSGHGFYDVVALDFDDESLIAAGFNGRIYRYHVEIEDSLSATAALVEGEGALRGLALEMQPTTTGGVNGPLFYDDLTITEDDEVVYDSAGFETLEAGAVAGQDNWIADSDGGHDPVQVVADPTGGGHGRVLEFDPVGDSGGWQGIARSFGGDLGADGDETIVIRWNQYRGDTDDNFWYADHPDFARWWGIQWDQSNAAHARQFDGQTVPLRTGAWQQLTYTFDLAAATVTVETPTPAPVTNLVAELIYQAPAWYGEARVFGGLYQDTRGHSVLVTGTDARTDLAPGNTPRVVAYDVTDNNMLWFYDTEMLEAGFNVRGGPLIGPDGKIYFFDPGTGVLHALEPGDGGFRITSITSTGAPPKSAEIAWMSVVEPGLYRVERATAAGGGADWTDISGTIATLTYSDETAPFAAGQAFYRVAHDPAGTIRIFFDDFEEDLGWTTGGTNSNWERGTPIAYVAEAPGAASSGVNCWGTGLAADYLSDATAWIESPPIDLTGFASTTLELKAWRMLEDPGVDEVYIQVFEDGGALLDELGPIVDKNPAWEDRSFDLGAGAGTTVRIRFELRSDESIEVPGLYVDDILVTAP